MDGSSQENGGSRDAGSHGENGSSHGENGTAQDTASSSTESLLALSVLSKDQLDALYEPLPGGRRDGPEIAARALSTFTFIDKSEYKGAADGLANDQDESIPCDCSYTPTPGGDGVEDSEDACGERCINRALKMECRRGECPCGEHCHNQR